MLLDPPCPQCLHSPHPPFTAEGPSDATATVRGAGVSIQDIAGRRGTGRTCDPQSRVRLFPHSPVTQINSHYSRDTRQDPPLANVPERRLGSHPGGSGRRAGAGRLHNPYMCSSAHTCG